MVGDLLKFAVESAGENLTELRALDLGAGNGIMGDVLKHHGMSRAVGADIIPEARDAAYRDRPHVYDEYYVSDFTNLQPSDHEQLAEWAFNCLTCVAALGFGDIPAQAFLQAAQLVQPGGWVAFNIKETFLDASDQSGFSRLIRELIFSEYLDLHQLQRYRHRLGMDGSPLFYFALVAKKTADIPVEFLEQHGLSGL
ncbi:methyltransferase domain-containing protein [Botrimarina mediterranea]|uniref:Methyltransferase domain protein n=2 Tax=Botrimarina mediterranea TaxID=2528022 RepID=A0A518K340_9BACT|nr:methyltransferase domain-containing protein [Botrimarina mediterranea]QDV72197.1 Methyltransferase domain protein [Botrimarina mediterranea]QDV76740.1 Methyltransferase domain protein [Planctomycetes bacterium K2D]